MRNALAVSAVALALMVVSAPGATTSAYYYGTMSASTPTGECSAFPPSQTGVACHGWNYWDYSRVVFVTSGRIRWGFIFNNGTNDMYVKDSGTVGANTTVTVVWNDSFFGGGVTHYNRALCGAMGTGSSPTVSCQALIFP
jgi:hypothetical protein